MRLWGRRRKTDEADHKDVVKTLHEHERKLASHEQRLQRIEHLRREAALHRMAEER